MLLPSVITNLQANNKLPLTPPKKICSTKFLWAPHNPLKCENEFTNIWDTNNIKASPKFLWIQKPFFDCSVKNVYYIQVICWTDATIIEKLHSRISGIVELLSRERAPTKARLQTKQDEWRLSFSNWPQKVGTTWCVFQLTTVTLFLSRTNSWLACHLSCLGNFSGWKLIVTETCWTANLFCTISQKEHVFQFQMILESRYCTL